MSRRALLSLVASVVALAGAACSSGDSDGERAAEVPTTTALGGPTLPTVATDIELVLPDTCEVVTGDLVAEIVGFAVEASGTTVTEDADGSFAIAECTYAGAGGSVSVELVATDDPDAYLDLVRSEAAATGGNVVDPGIDGLPPETVAVERPGARTYVVGGAAAFAVTGMPEIAAPLAVALLDHV